MKAFILMISLGVSSYGVADDGRWYDYKGNLVRGSEKVEKAPVEKPQKKEALGEAYRWDARRNYRRVDGGRLIYYPYRRYHFHNHSHWNRAGIHYGKGRWRGYYRSPHFNIVIER